MTSVADPPAPPRVFLCHATADRAFAESLGRGLAANGVVTWADFWEVRYGDSLGRKLYVEGIAGADAFVLVHSPQWAHDPWLADQLDSMTVRRIESGCRLVPVLLDSAPAPAPLAHLHPLRTGRSEPEALRAAVEIARTLYGINDRPPVLTPSWLHGTEGHGPAVRTPPPAQNETPSPPPFPGLPEDHLTLLRLLLHQALEVGELGPLPWSEEVSTGSGVPPRPGEREGALGALEAAGLVSVTRHRGRILWCELTPQGYHRAVPSVVPDLDAVRRRVIERLAGHRPEDPALRDTDLATAADAPLLVVRQQLEELVADRRVTLLRPRGGLLLTGVDPAPRARPT
ncbi:toll/interleukin-1 receptor domain-containing protein [Streptomyces sp. AP-93]|uniref:toll/interleukin-1 receptor domain-containing protein n=1 Tax=Streptomyces sp. AP-93 TaxID=2929048 RepID=UPI001FAF6E05|nr:toll/interleukin-1 receptor domain-containing protein [Streptomyces sp. AP-93]MCJ0872066.1 toll/interleukin-1 receptor domain-containing protein [Streptomyces sp. AP-93]